MISLLLLLVLLLLLFVIHSCGVVVDFIDDTSVAFAVVIDSCCVVRKSLYFTLYTDLNNSVKIGGKKVPLGSENILQRSIFEEEKGS